MIYNDLLTLRWDDAIWWFANPHIRRLTHASRRRRSYWLTGSRVIPTVARLPIKKVATTTWRHDGQCARIRREWHARYNNFLIRRVTNLPTAACLVLEAWNLFFALIRMYVNLLQPINRIASRNGEPRDELFFSVLQLYKNSACQKFWSKNIRESIFNVVAVGFRDSNALRERQYAY